MRQLPDGSCCPPWTRADGSSCSPRASSRVALPRQSPYGSLSLAVDERGLGLVGATSANQVAAFAEQRAGGEWASVPITAAGSPSELVLAAGGRGVALLTWRDSMEGRSEIRHVFRSSGGWSDGGVISSSPGGSSPWGVVGSDGEAVLVWVQQQPKLMSGVAVAKLAPQGERFERSAGSDDHLSLPLKDVHAPEVAVNERGQALVTWFQPIGGGLRVFVSERSAAGQPFTHPGKDDPLSFDSTQPEGSDGHYLGDTTAAVAADGRGAVAWTQPNERGSTCVYLATRNLSGQWTKQRSLDEPLSTPRGHAYRPRLAFAPSGDLFVVWRRAEGDASRIELAHRGPEERWSPTIRLSDEQAAAFEPRIVAGKAGGIVATWVEQTDRARLVARRSSTDLVVDYETEAWGTPSVLASGRKQGQYAVALAVGGADDRVLVGWVIGEELQVFSID